MTPVGQMVIELIETGQLDRDIPAIEQAIRNKTGQGPGWPGPDRPGSGQYVGTYVGTLADMSGARVRVHVGDRVTVDPRVTPNYLINAKGTITGHVRGGRSMEIRLDEPWHTRSAKLRGPFDTLRFKTDSLRKL